MIAGRQGELQPKPEDLAIARALGRRVAEITHKVRGSTTPQMEQAGL
jgi:NAD(P)H dehydrogenase (quinone)